MAPYGNQDRSRDHPRYCRNYNRTAPKVQGGSSGEGASVRGDGNVGGGPAGEGDSKRQ